MISIFINEPVKLEKEIQKKNVLPLQRLLHNIALSFNLYHIIKNKDLSGV